VVVQVNTIDVQTNGEWYQQGWTLFVHGWKRHGDGEKNHGEVKHWWCDQTGLRSSETHEETLIEGVDLIGWFWRVVFLSFITWHLL
jgi:hypothetical protein